MAATTRVQLGGADRIEVQAEPLTASGFAPFGNVVADPQPGLDPAAAATTDGHGLLPANAVSANQGSAIQYRDASRVSNLYHRAPSGRGSAKMSVFVCAARGGDDTTATLLPIRFLERHPFTTQTFSPLRSSASTYLVVVAPSLPPPSPSSTDPPPLPGSADAGGLPDLRGLRAFVATDAQAVTYGAGTWHAPMVVLGEPGAALAFVVTQFASGVDVEDCQLVEYVARDGGGVLVGVGRRPRVRERL